MTHKKFSITAVLEYDKDSLEAFIRMIENVIDTLTKDETTRFFLNVAINELVVNAFEHGYSKSGGSISIFLLKQPDSIVLEVSDSGSGIRLENLNLEKEVHGLDDLTIRGWGLTILKKVSSSFHIRANNPTGTIVSLTMPQGQPITQASMV